MRRPGSNRLRASALPCTTPLQLQCPKLARIAHLRLRTRARGAHTRTVPLDLSPPPFRRSAALSNTAEITSTNIRSGAAFDNIRASWNQALKLGDFSSKLRCDYDYKDNKDFLKEVSLTGDLMEASSNDELRVSYDVTHNFPQRKTNVKLTANTGGNTIRAELDDRQLKQVSAQRDLDLGDQKVNTDVSWMVKAQTARVKLMSNLGGGNKDRVKAQIDYDTRDNSASYEVGYQHQLNDGRDVSATFNPGDKNLDVEFVDNKFESGATWTAKASVPLENAGGNLLDNAKVTLKRSWSW